MKYLKWVIATILVFTLSHGFILNSLRVGSTHKQHVNQSLEQELKKATRIISYSTNLETDTNYFQKKQIILRKG